MVSGKSWGIVGGGILGMSLALQLAKKGHAVTLLEAEERLGGLISSYNGSGLTWDRYYHVILQSDTWTQNLLKELQLEQSIHWVKARSGFYSGGTFYSMSNIWEFFRFPLLSAWDKIRLGLTILYASRAKNRRKFERLSVEEWLIRWSGKNAFNKIWLPLLRSKLGDSYKETSAAFIQATIARMYSARNRQQKVETFGYVPGGYAAVLRRLTQYMEDAGIQVKKPYPVHKITTGEENGISIINRAGDKEKFDQVILTLPSPLVSSLCPDLSREEHLLRKGKPYLGIICGSLLLKKALSGFYITNITDRRIPFTAVIEMTALMDRKDYSGNSLVYLPKYVPSDDSLFETPEKDIKQTFFQAILRMFPKLKQSDIVCFRTAKDRYVFSPPMRNKGHRAGSYRTSLPGVFVVNSECISRATLNVNEILALSERALDKILSE